MAYTRRRYARRGPVAIGRRVRRRPAARPVRPSYRQYRAGVVPSRYAAGGYARGRAAYYGQRVRRALPVRTFQGGRYDAKYKRVEKLVRLYEVTGSGANGSFAYLRGSAVIAGRLVHFKIARASAAAIEKAQASGRGERRGACFSHWALLKSGAKRASHGRRRSYRRAA